MTVSRPQKTIRIATVGGRLSFAPYTQLTFAASRYQRLRELSASLITKWTQHREVRATGQHFSDDRLRPVKSCTRCELSLTLYSTHNELPSS